MKKDLSIIFNLAKVLQAQSCEFIILLSNPQELSSKRSCSGAFSTLLALAFIYTHCFPPRTNKEDRRTGKYSSVLDTTRSNAFCNDTEMKFNNAVHEVLYAFASLPHQVVDCSIAKDS
jgi:hypothetical protein